MRWCDNLPLQRVSTLATMYALPALTEISTISEADPTSSWSSEQIRRMFIAKRIVTRSVKSRGLLPWSSLPSHTRTRKAQRTTRAYKQRRESRPYPLSGAFQTVHMYSVSVCSGPSWRRNIHKRVASGRIPFQSTDLSPARSYPGKYFAALCQSLSLDVFFYVIGNLGGENKENRVALSGSEMLDQGMHKKWA